VIRKLAFQEVGHVDLVLVFFVVGVGEDISTLKGLRAEAENIVDDEYGGGGAGGASRVSRMSTIIGETEMRGEWVEKHTGFEAAKVDEFTLLFVAFRDYWRNGATRLLQSVSASQYMDQCICTSLCPC